MESTEEKLLEIQQSVFQEVLQRCPSCEISHIDDDEFSCPIGPDSDDILYRAHLYGIRTQPDNCLELLTAVTDWVQSSRASLQVQSSQLLVAGNCMVEIESLQSDLDCPLPTTAAEGVKPGASVGSGTVIGAAAGVVGAILLVTVIVIIIAVVIILKKKKQKRCEHIFIYYYYYMVMHPYIAEIHHDCTLNNYYLQDNYYYSKY